MDSSSIPILKYYVLCNFQRKLVLHEDLITLHDNPAFLVFKGLGTRLIYHIICADHPILEDTFNSNCMYNYYAMEKSHISERKWNSEITGSTLHDSKK